MHLPLFCIFLSVTWTHFYEHSDMHTKVRESVLSLKQLQDWVATNWKSKAVELEGSREGTVEPPVHVDGQFKPWHKRPCSLCHYLTYSPVWNGSSCFFTVPHNGAKWLWLAELQCAAKGPQCREKWEKVWNRQKREQCCHVISDTERACTLPSELI